MSLRVIIGLSIWFLLIRINETIHVPNVYEWMEKNAYICEVFSASKTRNVPIFLTAKEAEGFACEEICGNPTRTELACGRILDEQVPNDPSCFESNPTNLYP
uniref:Uncharacterized protein n=1 Tax=Panagrolaimus sp. JU765 TaxID=591449 RepID=A0AC34Q9E4_9BILA